MQGLENERVKERFVEGERGTCGRLGLLLWSTRAGMHDYGRREPTLEK